MDRKLNLNPLSCWIYLCTTLLPNFCPVNLQHCSYKYVFSISVENSVDPDQLASEEASWSGFTVFSKSDKSRFSRRNVNFLRNVLFYWKFTRAHIYSFVLHWSCLSYCLSIQPQNLYSDVNDCFNDNVLTWFVIFALSDKKWAIICNKKLGKWGGVWEGKDSVPSKHGLILLS